MRGKVVTIFGGSGFIGKHLVRRLAAAGATIRIPTRNPQAALALKPMGDVGQIVPERWSGEAADLAALVDGADFAVNLIGILFESRRGDFDRLQGDLPGRIGAVATAAGLRRMVHVSAIGADPDSASDYARTKAAGEAGIRAAYPDATILRPSIVFGPDDGFFNRFARMAQVSPFLPLIGGGKTRFQPVFVGDVAEAVVASSIATTRRAGSTSWADRASTPSASCWSTSSRSPTGDVSCSTCPSAWRASRRACCNTCRPRCSRRARSSF